MKQTPLHDVHVALGARMVEFGGWHMPLQYGSILEEGKIVRTACGLFDLSHMGRFQVQGRDAVALVDRVCTNHCAKIPTGSIRYSLLCNEEGRPLDDLLIYRDAVGVYLVVNASNSERDLAWIRGHIGGLAAEVRDETSDTAMLALQGPRSQEILAKITRAVDLAAIRYYAFGFGTVAGLKQTRISRTGYTGEDGFELYLPKAEGARVWQELLAAGTPAGLKPIGLGARDVLRLEAGMALYGHELSAEGNPREAGIEFALALTPAKGDFIGRAGLERLGAARGARLVGITTEGPRVPRQGQELFQGGAKVGVVASGGVSPTLGTNIGSAFVKLGLDKEGVELELDVRGKRQSARVRELPFYSRTRKK
ncbi:MAG: glycine cleavage system aminomethyltransferase GcvT [Planctomycetes bacterium]|nr:glycine cleavage system aminomethyltransferase GcvT [Planctomycetota bacterium]